MYTSYLYLLECPTPRQKQCYSLEQNKIPCCLAVMAGTACTPSLRSSSSAPCAWSSFYGGTWAGSVPSSVCTARGLWTAPVWSSGSDATSREVEASGKTDHKNVILERSRATCPVCAKMYFQVWFTPSAPGWALTLKPGEVCFSQVIKNKDGEHLHGTWIQSVTFGSKLRLCARSGLAQSCITASFSNTSTYLDVVDWVNVLHRVHHHFADLSSKEPQLTKLELFICWAFRWVFLYFLF